MGQVSFKPPQTRAVVTSAPDPNPTITAVLGSSQINTDNGYSQAADGNSYTRWITNFTTTGTLRYTLATPVAIQKYRITTPWGGVTVCPKDWTFEGSNDGTTFTVLDTRTNVTTWIPAASPTFTFTNATAYGYYRLNVSANNGSTVMGLSEMRLTGATGIALLGGNGGTMTEWWKADTITGRSNGDTVAFGDITDQSGLHNFTSAAGTSVYRPTGGPNNTPCVEHASVAGSCFDMIPASNSPTGDVTIFAVCNIPSTVTQQIFGGGVSGAALDINSGKFRMMKQASAQLAASTTSHPVGAWCAIIVTYVSATGATKFRIITTGSDVTDTIAGSANTFTENPTHLGWGCYDGTTNAAFRGSIAEMGRYAAALGTTDLDTLADTLKAKYGFSTDPTPVASWPVTETSGSAIADTVGGVSLTILGVATLEASQLHGHSVLRATTTNQMAVDASGGGTAPEPTTAITVMCWVRTTSTVLASFGSVMSKATATYDTYGLFAHYGSGKVDTPGCQYKTTNNASGELWASSALLADHAFHHLAMTYDGASVKLYCDATQVASASATGTLVYDAGNTFAALGNDHYPNWFAGDGAEFRIYDVALTQAQIATAMTS